MDSKMNSVTHVLTLHSQTFRPLIVGPLDFETFDF